MPLIDVTSLVLNPEISNEVNNSQRPNIKFISVTLLVSSLETSKTWREEHFWNM